MELICDHLHAQKIVDGSDEKPLGSVSLQATGLIPAFLNPERKFGFLIESLSLDTQDVGDADNVVNVTASESVSLNFFLRN